MNFEYEYKNVDPGRSHFDQLIIQKKIKKDLLYIKKFEDVKEKYEIPYKHKTTNSILYILKGPKYLLLCKEVPYTEKEKTIIKTIRSAYENGETNLFPYVYTLWHTNKKMWYIHDYYSYDFMTLLRLFKINNITMASVIMSGIIRVLLGTITLRRHGILHLDLHLNNILIAEAPRMIGLFKYEFPNKKSVTIPASKVDIVISDFGLCEYYSPDNENISETIKHYFPFFHMSKGNKNNINENVYYIDIWRFLKTLLILLAEHPFKFIRKLISWILIFIPKLEEKILKLYDNIDGDNKTEYAEHILEIIEIIQIEYSYALIGEKRPNIDENIIETFHLMTP